MQNKVTKAFTNYGANLCLVLLVLLMLSPILFMFSMSFKTTTELAQSSTLALPSTLYLGNYLNAYENMNYLRNVINSVGITVSVAILSSLLGSMAAYPLARRTNAITRTIVLIIALGLATPNFVVITPIYVMFLNLGLLDTYIGIIIAFTVLQLPLAVFFYTSFISTIPKELEEAARLDNCKSWRVFWYVVFPLLRPATATLSLFIILFVWNDFTYPLLLLTDESKFTVTISVYRFVGNHNVNPEMLFPAAVLGSLPLLVMFLFFQRRIISGITSGAVK